MPTQNPYQSPQHSGSPSAQAGELPAVISFLSGWMIGIGVFVCSLLGGPIDEGLILWGIRLVASFCAGWGGYSLARWGMRWILPADSVPITAGVGHVAKDLDREMRAAATQRRWAAIGLAVITAPIAAGSAFCCTCWPIGEYLYPNINPAFWVGGIAAALAAIGAWSAGRKLLNRGNRPR